MSWNRVGATLIAVGIGVAPGAASALTQSAGPLVIGPSVANGDTQNYTANLSTMVTNNGDLPDRLINVGCPTAGAAHLLNGTVREVDGAQRDGLDIPAASHGKSTPVAVQISLTKPAAPVVNGTLVPCSLYFEHGGQRIVIFMLGEHERASNEP